MYRKRLSRGILKIPKTDEDIKKIDFIPFCASAKIFDLNIY